MKKKNKRIFILYISTLTFLFSFPILFSNEDFDYLIQGPMTGGLYYTKKKPGRWTNVATSHIPVIEKKASFLEVTTPHEMRGFEHFIIKHIILDKNFRVISEKYFDPSKDRAYSRHDISGYTDSLYVMSICNQHDTWLEPLKLK